ncbi:MAG TPA: hypothetical protein VFC65_00405 [Prolixibacteraceae bacterium]|nr:hypothetical protein [Prolixibacteraceae bacterium]
MAKTTIYYFNPTCELAVANGSFSYMPPLLLQEMERDLAILPFIFGNENDFVLTENLPSASFLQRLKDAGFILPEFGRLSELEAMPDNSPDAICPWGWSPAAHFKLKNLKEKCASEFKASPVFAWKDEHKFVFERETSLNFLNGILDKNTPDWFVNRTMTGVKVTTCEEIESLLKQHSAVVLKAPVSSSGRGVQIIRKKKLNIANRQWISGIIKQQNYLIAEPFLEKRTDLSFQFRILPDTEIDYLGYSIFETNSNGQYKGTRIHPDLKIIMPENNTHELEEMIRTTANVIMKALKSSVYAGCHRGFLGVDALIFSDQNRLMMQPCIEVNSRMNMGILVLFLQKKIHLEASGKFELFYGSPGEFLNFSTIQTQLNPPKLKEGKLFSGFIPLVEPDISKKFGAYISLETDR